MIIHLDAAVLFIKGTDSCSVLLLMPGGVADNKWKDGRQQNLDGIVCCYSDDILMLLPFHL